MSHNHLSPELLKMRSALKSFKKDVDRVSKIVTAEMDNKALDRTLFNVTELKRQIKKGERMSLFAQREEAKLKVLGSKEIKSSYNIGRNSAEEYLKFLIGSDKIKVSDEFKKDLQDKLDQINFRSLSLDMRVKPQKPPTKTQLVIGQARVDSNLEFIQEKRVTKVRSEEHEGRKMKRKLAALRKFKKLKEVLEKERSCCIIKSEKSEKNF